jgi:para-aminobenzoate synthetase/4-amino-4-deoxychorismate lyase
VPIRTLALEPLVRGVRRAQLGVGAGIVFDSSPQDEFAECQLKARFLTGLSSPFELFETLRASRQHGCRHLDLHVARLGGSAYYFGFAFDPAALLRTVAEACAALPAEGEHRLRLGLAQDGSLTLQTAPLAPLTEPVGLLLAEQALEADDLFLRHKSSVRAHYDAGWRAAEAKGGFDTLFFNQHGELTEGGRSNVLVQIDGKWLTPPLSCGLLPGVMRSVLLADPAWQVEQRIITRTMLEQADDIVVCNALRGPLKARLL